MPFSYHSFQEIWERAGGRGNAHCITCKIYHHEGYVLDCSHLDHTKDRFYDDPIRGVLECLNCHLCRHILIYFFALLKGKKKKIREARFACQSLAFRIIAGEDRWDGKSIPYFKSDIKQAKKIIKKLFSQQIQNATIQAFHDGFESDEIALAKKKVKLLVHMF